MAFVNIAREKFIETLEKLIILNQEPFLICDLVNCLSESLCRMCDNVTSTGLLDV